MSLGNPTWGGGQCPLFASGHWELRYQQSAECLWTALLDQEGELMTSERLTYLDPWSGFAHLNTEESLRVSEAQNSPWPC